MYPTVEIASDAGKAKEVTRGGEVMELPLPILLELRVCHFFFGERNKKRKGKSMVVPGIAGGERKEWEDSIFLGSSWTHAKVKMMSNWAHQSKKNELVCSIIIEFF